MAKNNVDNFHAKPCAECGHRTLHGTVSGCAQNTAELGQAPSWCPCRKYVEPTRDRAAGRAEGVALGRAGADAALHGYAMNDGDWRAAAEHRLDELIASGVVFTAEDVTDKVGVAPSPNAIGGLFQGRKRDMVLVGFTTATRPEAHGRALRTWQGRA